MAEIFRWRDLTSPELDTLARRQAVALLPMAAVEQHGAHLPLDTDIVIGQGIIEAACRRYAESGPDQPVIVLPPVSIGASLEHTHFAGTLSLPAEQAMATLRAIGEGVARAGLDRVVIFNSHGGNKAVMDMAALQLRADHGLLVVKASYFRFRPPANCLPADELIHGLHGGALETAMMMHLAPAKVRHDALAGNGETTLPLGLRRAEAGLTLGPEGHAGFAWMAEDCHSSGVIGAPGLADADTGQRLVTTFAERLAEILVETAGFDWACAGGRRV